jgi:hypothetical protein
MQVSSRTIGVSASCLMHRRSGEPDRSIFGGTGFFDLSLYLLAFCDDLAQGERRAHGGCFASDSSRTSGNKTAQLRVRTDRAVSNWCGPLQICNIDQALSPGLNGAPRSENAS